MSDDTTVRIAVVGDEGVGKTSLITAAATETFPDHPPPVLPPSKLPAEGTPEGVPVVITDTGSRPEDREALEITCQEASVIVLCFNLEKSESLARIPSYWMPELRRLGVSVPVMLVGCKSDVRPADYPLHQMVLPIVKAFPQIETCMECSAKKLQYVGEVFYYALKSVVHPMAPLYDPESQRLKPLCARALKRIFLLCDKDNDGILNDTELNDFQVFCFNAPLQPDELVGVKSVVAERIPQGVLNDGLTLPGFLFLHALFIERGRLETTWAVLRTFGYGNDLHLSPALLEKLPVDRLMVPDHIIELSEAGRAFFIDAFQRFDQDDDGVLSAREYEDMFSTAPSDPWHSPTFEGVLVETSRKGHLTMNGFLSKWAYTTMTDPQRTLAYAIYLGYPERGSPERLFQISKPRKVERRTDGIYRSVLQAYVFVSEGVDALPMMEGLIAQSRPAHGLPTGPVTAAVAPVPLANGSTVTLVLKTFTKQQEQVLLEFSAARMEETLASCDVAVFLFDGSQPTSFESAVESMIALASASRDTLPCIFVSSNDESTPTEVVETIGSACSALSVKMPTALGNGTAAYRMIVETALQAELAIPETPTLKARRQYRKMLRRAFIFTGLGTTAVLGGYFAWKWKMRQEQKEQAESSSAK